MVVGGLPVVRAAAIGWRWSILPPRRTAVSGGSRDGRGPPGFPGADLLGALGEIFRFRDERAVKTELVIFLRPTIIANPSLNSDELQFFQRFLPKPEAIPPQPEKTGAAQ